MNIDQSANFLIGSILTGLGAVVVTGAIVLINNIIAKYWKNLGWFSNWYGQKHVFLTEEEYQKIAPHLDQQEPTLKK